MIRLRAVLASLGYLLVLFSFTFIVPLLTGLLYDEPSAFLYRAYLVPLLLSACLGAVMWFHTRHRVEDLRERDAFVVVGIAWLFIALLGSLPYLFGGVLGPLDAYFESMSGFTTTGATTLNVTAGADFLDTYNHSLLVWRSLTAWLGGLGFIVFSVVLLSRYLEGGVHLFRAEVSGATVTRLRPKLVQTARLLLGIYILLTVISFGLLLATGIGGFDAANVSLSTLATGGFSVHAQNIGFYDSFAVELIVMAFMVVGGVNFVLHYKLLTGKVWDVLRDRELRFFVIFLLAFSALSVAALLAAGSFATGGENVRHGLFQIVSAATTGGFTTTGDLSAWPSFVHFLLILAMIFGACVGSTGGGIKASRLLLLLKNTKRGILKAIHPRAVMPIKVSGRPIKESVMDRVQMMFFAFLVVLALATLALCAAGLSVLESVSAVAGCLGNAGIAVFEPGNGFHNIPGLAKTVLVFCMWMGRLEIFTGLIVLAPSTYRS